MKKKKKNERNLTLFLWKDQLNLEALAEEARQQRQERGSPPWALQTHTGATGASTRTTAHGPATSPRQNPQASLQRPSTTEISRPTWFYRVQTFNEEIMLILHNLIQKKEGIIPSLAQEASITLEEKQMRTENKQNPHTHIPNEWKHHQQNMSKLSPAIRKNSDSQEDLSCDVRLVQYWKINQYKLPYWQLKEEKTIVSIRGKRKDLAKFNICSWQTKNKRPIKNGRELLHPDTRTKTCN